ncbi:MAG: glycosyltransferase family 4 protein [Halobacteriota archaeon]
MNIGYVSDVVYPFVKGGAEKRIYEMAKRFATNDEVHIFGVKWWKGKNDIELGGIHLHGVCKPLSLYAGERRSFREAARFASSLRPIFKQDLDIIDCNQFPYLHCFPARLISLLKSIPLVITWHEFWGDYWYEYLGKLGFFGKLTERATLTIPDEVIAVSTTTKELLEHFRKRVSFVPNGVDISLIDSIEPAEISVDALFVGRLIPEKNVELLVRAMPTSKMLCIIGDGPEKSKLVQLSKELGTNVRFSSELPYEDLIGVMKAANSLVLPSSREGFGIVALEALACGTPVITSNVQKNAARELITHGENGFVVDLKEDQLRSALLEVDKKRMQRAAQAGAAFFDWNLLSAELRKLYESLT